MFSAIVGDMIGSIYEKKKFLPKQSPIFGQGYRFTDDTVFTIATCDSLLNQKNIIECYQYWGKKHKNVGASRKFTAWLESTDPQPYEGDTNGCLMRISPVCLLSKSNKDALEKAQAITAISHNSEQALQSVHIMMEGLLILKENFLLHRGLYADEMKISSKNKLMKCFDSYGLKLRTVEEIHLAGEFRMKALQTLEDVFACLNESSSFEDVMQNCIYCGGDVDTLCAVAGPFAELMFGIPSEYINPTLQRLPQDMKQIIQQEYIQSDLNGILNYF